jgi:GH15 family glucan-1,4-alpha-glucosidase
VHRPLRALRRRRRWGRARDAIAERVWAALDDNDLLPQVIGQEPARPDASALMGIVFGLFGRNDPRTGRLLDATVAALDAAPFLYRYPPDGRDGFGGREGAFLPVSAWVVTALATTGRVREAEERLDALCGALPRLLPEEVDPVTGEGLGNVPLVWSHAELARALYVVDAEALRARWGRGVLWAWRVARYARLRWG